MTKLKQVKENEGYKDNSERKYSDGDTCIRKI